MFLVIAKVAKIIRKTKHLNMNKCAYQYEWCSVLFLYFCFTFLRYISGNAENFFLL